MGSVVALKESQVEKLIEHLKQNLNEESRVFFFYENDKDESFNVSSLNFSPAELVFALETLKVSIVSGGM